MKYKITKNTTNINERINYMNKYTLAILKCEKQQTEIHFSIKIEIKNKNEQHLSIEDVPLINLYLIFSIFYIILTITWIIMIIMKFRIMGGLQYIFTISLILKLVYSISFFLFYFFLSNLGNFSIYIMILKNIISIVTETSFLVVNLLISFGWSLTRNYLSMREKQLFWGGFILYFLFRILYAFCYEPALCSFFILLLGPAFVLGFKMLQFIITFAIVVILNTSIERLRRDVTEQISSNDRTELYTKIQIFKYFFLIFI
jgi:hypothetical protein